MTTTIKNKYLNNYQELLSTIHASGTKSFYELNTKLTALLWINLYDLVFNYSLKGQKNSRYVYALEDKLELEKYDIGMNCLEKTIQKFDFILAQPLTCQLTYTLTIINNCLLDHFKIVNKMPGGKIDSLNKHIEINGNHHELQELIPDKSSNIEEHVIIKEIIKNRQTDVVKELKMIKKASEIMAYIAIHYLNYKPSQIVSRILGSSTEAVFAELLIEFCHNYGLKLNEIGDIVLVLNQQTNQLSLGGKLDTPQAMSQQISRLANRAKSKIF